jgi:hypothetical protein
MIASTLLASERSINETRLLTQLQRNELRMLCRSALHCV